MKASFALFSVASAEYQCPGGALIHASMKVTATASASCSAVEAEITGRTKASQAGSWVDPHNGGIYSLTSSENGVIKTERSTNPGTSVPAGTTYVDKQIFVLTDSGDSCKIEACSESQSTSVGDFSTNYCDIRNLYGGSADGYSVVANDFEHVENSHKGSIGAGHDASKCIVTSLGVSLPNYCPGSSASIHANAQITAATATASCDVVKQELKDRLAGKNGWYDQHNRGTYTEVAASGAATVSATRLTGNGKYTDKINWVLSGSGDTCSIQACSESQVFSIADSSANYCNMKLPICGSDEGCLVANSDFSSKGETVTKSTGASTGLSNCLASENMAV